MKYILNLFFKGLLFVVPVGATIYILIATMLWLDNFLTNWQIPGFGIFIVLLGTTAIGYLGSLWLTRPLIHLPDYILEKVPLVGLLYSSLKDLTSAVVGEKKKFGQPVLVTLSKDSNLKQIGFVTQEDLEQLGLKEYLAVYLPHSYGFSGNLYVVKKENIELIPADGTATMKFIISAGISGLDDVVEKRNRQQKRLKKNS